VNTYKQTSISEALKLSITEKDWKIHVFNFVDDFRRTKSFDLIQEKPVSKNLKLMALSSAIVSELCDEVNIPRPEWVRSVNGLVDPWFVSGIENLKATALLESPIYYKIKNIFVLNNFLTRV
jgi:hypothetical protein